MVLSPLGTRSMGVLPSCNPWHHGGGKRKKRCIERSQWTSPMEGIAIRPVPLQNHRILGARKE